MFFTDGDVKVLCSVRFVLVYCFRCFIVVIYRECISLTTAAILVYGKHSPKISD